MADQSQSQALSTHVGRVASVEDYGGDLMLPEKGCDILRRFSGDFHAVTV